MKVLYIYDALCGWCYAFRPVIKKLYLGFREQVDFEVISGGMITGNRVGEPGQIPVQLREVCTVVERTTKVDFGSRFKREMLMDGKVVFDSFPPSKALTVIKDLRPDLSVDFCQAIQDAIYGKGKDPSDEELYPELAQSLGVSSSDFRILWSSFDYDVRTKEDFILTRLLGVRRFPALYFENSGSYRPLTRGYASYEVLAEKVYRILE